MLNLSGNLCEMGDLDGVPETRGLRIERPDGSVVTITGLTREEVQGLGLFADVSLAVTADPLPPLAPGEREQIADYVASYAEWVHCDCGCPGQKTTKSAADVRLVRIGHDIRMGRYDKVGAKPSQSADAERPSGWPDAAVFVDLDNGQFLDEQANLIPPEPQGAPLLGRRHSVLEMLGYELDGVLADVAHGQGGTLDAVCLQTVERVRKRLHEIGRSMRAALLPQLPTPHWPEASVPADAFTEDQMREYGRLTLAAYGLGLPGSRGTLKDILQKALAALEALQMHAKGNPQLQGPVWCADQSISELRRLLPHAPDANAAYAEAACAAADAKDRPNA